MKEGRDMEIEGLEGQKRSHAIEGSETGSSGKPMFDIKLLTSADIEATFNALDALDDCQFVPRFYAIKEKLKILKEQKSLDTWLQKVLDREVRGLIACYTAAGNTMRATMLKSIVK
jgi:hypothetical protein